MAYNYNDEITIGPEGGRKKILYNLSCDSFVDIETPNWVTVTPSSKRSYPDYDGNGYFEISVGASDVGRGPSNITFTVGEDFKCTDKIIRILQNGISCDCNSLVITGITQIPYKGLSVDYPFADCQLTNEQCNINDFAVSLVDENSNNYAIQIDLEKGELILKTAIQSIDTGEKKFYLNYSYKGGNCWNKPEEIIQKTVKCSCESLDVFLPEIGSTIKFPMNGSDGEVVEIGSADTGVYEDEEKTQFIKACGSISATSNQYLLIDEHSASTVVTEAIPGFVDSQNRPYKFMFKAKVNGVKTGEPQETRTSAIDFYFTSYEGSQITEECTDRHIYVQRTIDACDCKNKPTPRKYYQVIPKEGLRKTTLIMIACRTTYNTKNMQYSAELVNEGIDPTTGERIEVEPLITDFDVSTGVCTDASNGYWLYVYGAVPQNANTGKRNVGIIKVNYKCVSNNEYVAECDPYYVLLEQEGQDDCSDCETILNNLYFGTGEEINLPFCKDENSLAITNYIEETSCLLDSIKLHIDGEETMTIEGKEILAYDGDWYIAYFEKVKSPYYSDSYAYFLKVVLKNPSEREDRYDEITVKVGFNDENDNFHQCGENYNVIITEDVSCDCDSFNDAKPLEIEKTIKCDEIHVYLDEYDKTREEGRKECGTCLKFYILGSDGNKYFDDDYYEYISADGKKLIKAVINYDTNYYRYRLIILPGDNKDDENAFPENGIDLKLIPYIGLDEHGEPKVCDGKTITVTVKNQKCDNCDTCNKFKNTFKQASYAESTPPAELSNMGDYIQLTYIHDSIPSTPAVILFSTRDCGDNGVVSFTSPHTGISYYDANTTANSNYIVQLNQLTESDMENGRETEFTITNSEFGNDCVIKFKFIEEYKLKCTSNACNEYNPTYDLGPNIVYDSTNDVITLPSEMGDTGPNDYFLRISKKIPNKYIDCLEYSIKPSEESVLSCYELEDYSTDGAMYFGLRWDARNTGEQSFTIDVNITYYNENIHGSQECPNRMHYKNYNIKIPK